MAMLEWEDDKGRTAVFASIENCHEETTLAVRSAKPSF